MVRNFFNKIYASKAFYIVFSVLVSIALWMYVEIRENTTQQIRVTGVPVVCLNEDVLSDRNLLISDMRPETVTLTFDCSRSVASKLTKDTLSVVIDLANIVQSGYNTLRHEISYPSGIDESMASIVERSVTQIQLYVDRQSSRGVRVEAPYRGGTAEGYMSDQTEYSPREITVYGPAEIVSELDVARAQILRENLTTTYNDDVAFTLFNRSGDEIDEEDLAKLTFSDEFIHVSVPVRMIKEVALSVGRSYGSGATEQNTIVTIDPQFITVAGDPEELRDYNSVTLTTVDVTRFAFSDTNMYPIALPNNFTNISGETEARVLVEVLGLDIKYLAVSNANIHCINLPAGHTVDIITQSLDVRIRGREEYLFGVTEANISVVADLVELGTGTQRVSSRIYVDGVEADVGAVGLYNVVVAIQKE